MDQLSMFQELAAKRLRQATAAQLPDLLIHQASRLKKQNRKRCRTRSLPGQRGLRERRLRKALVPPEKAASVAHSRQRCMGFEPDAVEVLAVYGFGVSVETVRNG